MRDRRARVADVHEIALSMPHVTGIEGPKGNAIYQVGGKSFVFFRTPQPDAQDPATGERYADVIMIWVESESDKLSLIQDPDSPFFTTERFDGHPSVLVRAKDLRAIGRNRADRADSGRLVVAGIEAPRRPVAGRKGTLACGRLVVDSTASERPVGLRYPTSNTKLNASPASGDPRARGPMWMV